MTLNTGEARPNRAVRGFRIPALLLLALVLHAGLAVAGPGPVSVVNLDQRRKPGTPPARLTDDQAAGLARLQALIPGSRVDLDPVLGSPAWVLAPQGILGGPFGRGRGTASKAGGPDTTGLTQAFLNEHRRLFRHGSEVLEGAPPKQDYVTGHNGLRTTVWKQELDGIPLHEGLLVSHVTGAGELVALSSRFLPNPAAAADAEYPNRKTFVKRPRLSARAAALRAIAEVDEAMSAGALQVAEATPDSAEQRHEFRAAGLPGAVRASLAWLPLSTSRLRLCWLVEVTRRHRGETFLLLIDAQTGETLLRRCLTLDLSEATYRVFTGESPSPFLPGWPSPNTNQPPRVERGLTTLAALSTNASPTGWINDVDNETRGNNVDAHLDWDGDNQPDLPRPQGAPERVFDFPLDLNASPYGAGPAAVVQLFYWCNWMHDRLYDLGFTEAAGNFQKDNFGRGGQAGDPVLADAQDGSGYNNANFTPLPEGRSPRIQMFVFNSPSPFRDGDFDATVILHEYAHGLSDRLIGGGVGISQLQTYGLAEGWSDFYALALLSNPADPPDSCYPLGAYVGYLLSETKANYYFGLRRYPVTTDLARSPLTFKDVDPNQASLHPGVPRNPILTSSPAEVHMVGEVWCAMLWEARARLMQKHGPAAGNELMLRLVTDGLKLSPPNPTFVQARNAILLADTVANSGANRNELWGAFAKRGLGYGASSPDNTTTVGVREAFDLPDSLSLSSSNTLVFSGTVGGPFLPPTHQCTLVNAGSSAVAWTLGSTPSWITVFPTQGGVLPYASNSVTLTINTLANSLLPGLYPSSVSFVSAGGGQTLTASLILQVTDSTNGQSESLNELFSGQGDFDLDYSTLTFTPTADTNAPSYTACLTTASGLPTDPAGGEVILPMVDDSYRLVSLGEGKEVSLYGARTNQVLIGSNGDLMFDVPTDLGYQFDPVLQLYTNFFYSQDSIYFSRPRVAPLYADLNPGAGGAVSWQQLSDRLAVTWQDVPEFGLANRNTFQVEWFFDGTLRFTWAGVAPQIGANYSTPKVGLVAGGGVPANFVETDFSVNHSCLPPIALLLPVEVTEGQGPWTGLVMLAVPSPAGTVVSFTCSETNATTVPVAVDIPPGDSSATFLLQIDDDHRLRGSRKLKVTAAASGYNTASQTVLVDDATVASLSVSIPPKAREGQGLISGTVSMDAVPEVPISVFLSSSSTLLQVAPTVAIQPGTNSTGFDMWVGDDRLITGPMAVAVSARVPNWNDDADAIIISDTESTNLSLALPIQVSEGAGTMAKVGQVTLGGYLLTNLSVALSCDNTNLAQLPPAVTIEAGQLSASFDVTIIDDPQPSPVRNVIALAKAAGFGDGLAIMQVIDNDSPSYPTNPSPAHLATRVSTDVILSWALPQNGLTNNLTYDVYFGTNPVPGSAELQGSTPTNAWPLARLATATTYYWQVVASSGLLQVSGPVWQFTTASLDRFILSEVASPQFVDFPFPITVTAVDELGSPASSFAGPAQLSALATEESTSSIVLTEVASTGFGRVEFANVSAREVDISGWQVVFYDWLSWPAPAATFNFPDWSFSAPGDLFQIRRPTVQIPPGSHPTYFMTNALRWNNNALNNPVAVLLLDRATNLVDFMCAVDADPTQITLPLPIPPAQWSGAPVAANLNSSFSYQRAGSTDHHDASDWMITTNNFGKTNQQLTLPFRDPAALAISPGQLLNFSNGVWTGHVVLQEISTNLVLQVDDGQGHRGQGNVFTVGAADDLSLSLGVAPTVQTVANPFTYTLTVSNTGPSQATGVVLLDNLPPEPDFLEATASQGTVTHLNGVLICELGTLAGSASATVSISLLAQTDGLITNRAAVTRIEAESYAPNNAVRLVSAIGLPRLSIADTSVTEGNPGATNLLVFKVGLSAPSQRPVTVGYATTDGTASQGSDYLPVSGVLEFAPGTTNLSISVPVVGDRVAESNETVYVNLSNATAAVITRPWAVGILNNDDGSPYMSIADATVTENAGGTNALFRVTLSAASALPIAVSWATTNGNAVGGFDYLPGSGWLYFMPGETEQVISIAVPDNTWYQPTRTFGLNLAYPYSAIFARYRAVGTILDDDAWRFHHFAWDIPAGTQYVHEPCPVTITAQNALNEAVTNYEGAVALSAGCSNRVAAVGTGTNQWEMPFGTYYLDGRLQVLYAASALGPPGRISGLALDVAGLPGQVLSNWTIRLGQTPMTNLAAASWATNLTVVHQSDFLVLSTGWVTIPFQTPFDYDGLSSLLVDLSFHNSAYSSDGFCRASVGSQSRSLYFRTDGAFGDPRQWAGPSDPVPVASMQYPNIRFSIEAPTSVTPAVISNFVNGVWSGLLTFNAPGAPVVLRAVDAGASTGSSSPFTVLWRDSDADGIPDEWEIANKLDPLDPADAGLDPDADGLTSLQEYQAGTDPHDPASALRILSIAWAGTNSVAVSFPTSTNRHYLLESNTDLTGNSWTAASPPRPGTGSVLVLTNQVNPLEPGRFLRVRADF